MRVHKEVQSYKNGKANDSLGLNKFFDAASFRNGVSLWVYQHQILEKKQRHHKSIDEVVQELVKPVVVWAETIKQVVEKEGQQICVIESFQKSDFLVVQLVDFGAKKNHIDSWCQKKDEAHDFLVFENLKIWLSLGDFRVHDPRKVVLRKMDGDHPESANTMLVQLCQLPWASINAGIPFLLENVLKFLKVNLHIFLFFGWSWHFFQEMGLLKAFGALHFSRLKLLELSGDDVHLSPIGIFGINDLSWQVPVIIAQLI
jgi:hypothetical protein